MQHPSIYSNSSDEIKTIIINFGSAVFQYLNLNKMTDEEVIMKYNTINNNDIRETYENFRSRCTSISTKTNIKEKGCTDSLYGIKSKCILNIVPKQSQKQTFKIDPKCKVKRLT